MPSRRAYYVQVTWADDETGMDSSQEFGPFSEVVAQDRADRLNASFEAAAGDRRPPMRAQVHVLRPWTAATLPVLAEEARDVIEAQEAAEVERVEEFEREHSAPEDRPFETVSVEGGPGS